MSSKLSPELNKGHDEAVSRFPGLQDANDVAEHLEIQLGQLIYILYKLPENFRFRTFHIPKRAGGSRTIDAPIGGTEILLNKLKPILSDFYRPKKCVHGFVNGRSVVSNAEKHVRQKFVLNVDLHDFYGSINFGRIYGLFRSAPFNHGNGAAAVLAHLCTIHNRLPQGAPTSPVLSNFVASELDGRLTRLANQYGVRYSRYADDITFSSNKKKFPASIAYIDGNNPIVDNVVLGKPLEDEISASGFSVNHKKVRMQIRGVRQEVTGLTVNEFPNVNRRYIRNIRAMLNAWEKYGLDLAEQEHIKKHDKHLPEPYEENGQYFKEVIYGHLSFLKMVRGKTDSIYIKFMLKAARLDPSPGPELHEVRKMHEEYDVFICHAGEDKDTVADPIYRALEARNVHAFLDKHGVSWGDSLTQKINHALSRAKYVIAVLSEDSVGKAWPEKEINSALAREIAGEQKILPLIVGSPDLSSIPLMQDKKHLEWNDNADIIADELQDFLS